MGESENSRYPAPRWNWRRRPLTAKVAGLQRRCPLTGDGCILVVAAGDAKIDNAKYKARFGTKAKMIPAAEVEEKIGHAVGGVCPFAVNEGVKIYLDESLKRFHTVFPACGSSNSAIELTMEELEEYSGTGEWVDVCKGWGMDEKSALGQAM